MSFRPSTSPTSDFVEYNYNYKRFQGLFMIGIIIAVMLAVGFYFGFVRRLHLFETSFIADFLRHVGSEITSFSFLGFFYIYFFGGLILLFLPSEPYFMTAMGTGNFHYINFIAIFLGLLFSYSINYLIGLRFSRFSSFLISTKKFYKVKNYVNKWGVFAVFLSNLFFGAQQALFVLGSSVTTKQNCYYSQ